MTLEARALTLRRGGRAIVDGFTRRFGAGTAVAVVGPNGAGKSSLLTLLAGLGRPDAGEVLAHGRPLLSMNGRERAAAVSYLPQNEAQDVPFTVGEYVALGAFQGREPSRSELEALLVPVGLAGFLDRRVESLSGGEFRLAAIARAAAQDARILLVDEIDLGLDLANRSRQAQELACRARRSGRLLVAVVHDINVASRHFDELVLLARGGRLLAAGPPREVVTKANLDALYMADVFVDEGADGAPVVAEAAPRREGGGPSPLAGRRVHVVCGGGTGGAALAALVSAGAAVSAGALNVGDSDWKRALALGAAVVEEEPFRPIGERARRENLARMREADRVLVVGMAIGPGNLANVEDVLDVARERPGRVALLSPARFDDHAEGRGAALVEALRRHAAAVDGVDGLAGES